MDYEERWKEIEENLASADLGKLCADAYEGYIQLGEDLYRENVADFDGKNWLEDNKFYIGTAAAAGVGHLLVFDKVDLGSFNSLIYDDVMHFTFGASTGGIGGVFKTLTAGGISAKEVMDIHNHLGYEDSILDLGTTVSGIYAKGPVGKIFNKMKENI